MDAKQAALMQMQIKNNAGDLQEYLKGLESWETDIKEKDVALLKQKPILKEKLPPVRGSHRQKEVKKKKKKVKIGTQNQPRIKSYDFKAWDKFDVDKACEDVDYRVESQSSSEGEEEEEEMQRRQQAVFEKEKGNELFKQGNYEMAVECYSIAAELDPLNPIMLANRAMALLKLERYAAVESDCSLALALDDRYLKAYLRRGTARLKLGKPEEARSDFDAVLRLESGNKLARAELEKLNKERDKKFVFPVKRPPHLRSKEPLKRIAIQDIGEDPEDSPPDPSTETTDTAQTDPTPNVQSTITTPPSNTDDESVNKQSPVVTPSPINSTEEEVMPQSKGALQLETQSLETMKTDSNGSKPLKIELLDSKEAQKSTTSLKMTITKTELLETKSPVDVSVEPIKLTLPNVPDNSIRLQADWKRLRRDRKLLGDYFKKLPISKYSSLFQQSLETDVFSDIVSILLEDYVRCGVSCLSEMQALTQVRRFSVALMFLSKKDKEDLQQLFKELKQLLSGDADSELIVKLQKTFGL